MEEPVTPMNPILNIILLISGTVGWLHAIGDINTVMDFILHCTGILSFVIFIFINWDKIKESYFKRLAGIKSMFKK
jgi:amino acid transporter